MKKFIAVVVLVTTSFVVSSEASCWEWDGNCVVSEVEDFGDGSCGTKCGDCIVKSCLPDDSQV